MSSFYSSIKTWGRCLTLARVITALLVSALWFFPTDSRAASSPLAKKASECDCDQTNQAEDSPCKKYLSKLSQSLGDCDLNTILAIGKSDQAAIYPCLKDAAHEAECSYFEKCWQPALAKAATTCELDKILEIEARVKSSLKNCTNYRLIKEIVLKYKCIDFANGCLKGFFKQALASCDFQQIEKLEKIILSVPLRSCPNYKRLKLLPREVKNYYFYNCLRDTIEKAQQDCDITRGYQLEVFITENMQDSFDYKKIQRQVSQIKCQKPENCLRTMLEKALSNCDLTWLLKLRIIAQGYSSCPDVDYEDIMELVEQTEETYLDSCGPGVLDEVANTCNLNELAEWEKGVNNFSGVKGFMKKIREKRCSLTANCLKQDLQVAVYNCDLTRIVELESWIDAESTRDCSSQLTELKESINAQREAYLDKCITQELEIALSVCDLARIIEINALIGSFNDCNNIKQIQQLATQTRDSYIEDCLARDFQHAIQGCQLESLSSLINQLEPLASQGGQKYKQLNQQIQQWGCQYMEGCVSEEIKKTIARADKDRLNFIKDFLAQNLSHCDRYPEYKSQVQQAIDQLPPSLP